jgi:uncharacterized phage-associated protein
MNIEIPPYDSVSVAQYMRALALEDGLILGVTKVQKLLYILYAYFLVKYDRRIINEQPQAWQFGPVFPHTRSKIDYFFKPAEHDFAFLKSDKDLEQALREIIQECGNLDAGNLIDWSHEPYSPWDQIVQDNQKNYGKKIPNDLIKKYFIKLGWFSET